MRINLLFPNETNALGSWASFDPAIAMQMIFYFGIQLLIVLPFTLISGGRSFCNYYCPMSVFGVIGTKIKNKLKYPSLHLDVNAEICTQCGKCTQKCPMSLDVQEMVNKKNISDVNCILCGECISNCPNEVIHYAWKWSK